jgi:hypothetical protein
MALLTAGVRLLSACPSCESCHINPTYFFKIKHLLQSVTSAKEAK